MQTLEVKGATTSCT